MLCLKLPSLEFSGLVMMSLKDIYMSSIEYFLLLAAQRWTVIPVAYSHIAMETTSPRGTLSCIVEGRGTEEKFQLGPTLAPLQYMPG